jgi:multiple antibiotic resistance protein
MSVAAILSVSLILFSVIDIIGSVPVIVDMKRQGMHINAGISTLAAGLLMIAFLFFGAGMLGLFGIDVTSFALAGSLIIFFIGLEMTLGIRFFRTDPEIGESGTIVPIAFPLLAGAGTLTTILSLKAEYDSTTIIIGIVFNLLVIFGVLHSSDWMAKKIPTPVMSMLRKVFGILLIAISFQMLRVNLGFGPTMH